jgi:hypothetical protein
MRTALIWLHVVAVGSVVLWPSPEQCHRWRLVTARSATSVGVWVEVGVPTRLRVGYQRGYGPGWPALVLWTPELCERNSVPWAFIFWDGRGPIVQVPQSTKEKPWAFPRFWRPFRGWE